MKNIFLIGFMGCGKSAISYWLSKNCGLKSVEMDQEIVNQEGMSIPEIFETKGETYFRDLETTLLQKIQGQSDCIVSCGGGVVLRDENIELMKKNGCVVLLKASPETILERVKHDENRPLLKGKKDVVSIKEMIDKRWPRYMAAADLVVSVDGRTPKEIGTEILKKVKIGE